MRRDLILGIIVAIAIHGGVAYVGQMNKSGPPARIKPPEEKIIQIKMPEMEPEEEEPTEEVEEVTRPESFVPPMQQDVPQPPQPEQFVQKLQPPPPEALQLTTGAITIPTGKLGSLGEIFDPTKLDQQPQAQVQIKPEYPFEMRRQGVAGTVTVEFIVDPKGTVASAWATKSTQKEFEKNAIAAVQKWKFKPGRKSGRDVSTHMVVDILFNLNEGK